MKHDITLYARAQNGKIKIWNISAYNNVLRTKHGYKDSPNLIEHTHIVVMKTIEAQLASMVRAKKKEGYKDSNEIAKLASTLIPMPFISYEWLDKYLPSTNLDDNYNLKPMKCQPFKPNKFTYPAIAQPKLNGVRGTLRWETIVEGEGVFASEREKAVIRSKNGLIYHLPHITDNLIKEDFIDKDTDMLLVYDGEIYLHNTPLNMINGASPLINNRGTIAKTKYPHITLQLVFVIFDIAIEDIAQSNRCNIIEQINALQNIKTLRDTMVYSDKDAINYTMECINAGYEGAVIRDVDAEYKFGSRPMSMMKIKKFYDAEFKIIDIIPKPKEPQTALFVCANDINDNTFECNPMGTFNQRKEYLDNKENYIGEMATVKFYERSGVKKVPFHANVISVRNYE